MTAAELTAAGVLIVADESSAVVPSGGRLLVTQAQADRMIAEQAAGGGLLGHEVDALAPMPSGSPPMSYLLAAWTAKGTTRSAGVARRLMGVQDWRHARQIAFPLAVVAMFVTDVARATAAARPTRPSRDGIRPPLGAVGSAADPCTAITGFLSTAIRSIFDALKLRPSKPGGGLFFVVQWFVDVWNYALDLAQGVVQAVVDKLTKPLFDALRAAIGALILATQVVSYFTRQTLTVTVEPARPYRFAVDPEPDIRGEFVARADSLTSKWPEALVKCAQVANKKLPEVLAPGSKATWKLLVNEKVVTPDAPAGQVKTDLTARLGFATGRESAEQAKGQPALGRATARVEVERHEINGLLDLARDQVKAVLNQLPLPQAVLDPIFDPLLKQLQSAIAGQVGGVFKVAGTGTVFVVYHKPPEPTPTPSPTPNRKGDFCTQYRAMAKWAYEHRMRPTPEAWAAEIKRRLVVMRPAAPPAKLHSLDVLITVYGLMAAKAGLAKIGNEAYRLNFPRAGKDLGTYCKVNPRYLSG